MDKKRAPAATAGTKAEQNSVTDTISQIATSERLTKVGHAFFADADMDFWQNDSGDVYMTSEQIGRALEYSDPVRSVSKLFERNMERLFPNSRVVRLTTVDGRERDVRVFNEKGVYEIIRRSAQPKADEFYDWVFEVLQSIRKTGSYNSSPQVNEHQVRTELLKAALEHEERLSTLEQRIETVEHTVTLDHGEQRGLQRSISRRVYELESEPEQRPDLFRQLHREIRDRWGVASYRDVRRVDLQEVLNYVRAWKPRMQLAG